MGNFKTTFMSFTIKKLMQDNPWYKLQVKAMFDKAGTSVMLQEIHPNCKGSIIEFDKFTSYEVFHTQDFYIDYNNFKFNERCKEIEPKTHVFIFNDN